MIINTKKLFPEARDEVIEYFDARLIDAKQFISLSSLFALYAKDIDLESGNILKAREDTLTYLQDLLEREELISGRVKRVPKGETPPPIDENDHSSVFEDIPGTNKEIIEYIRDNWDNNPDFNEQWDCVFRLPENPWPPTYHVGR